MIKQILLCLSLLIFSAQPIHADAQHDLPERILFVGNSFSYFNNGIESKVGNLVRSARIWKKGFHFRLLTLSGGHLYEHQSALEQRLDEQQWDRVVLQGHSQEPFNPNYSDQYTKSARQLAQLIRDHHARPALLMTWAYRDKPEMTQALYDKTRAVAEANHITLLPVGLAFAQSRKLYPEIALLAPDIVDTDANGKPVYGTTVKHPSMAGTYLAACVIFSVFYHQSPVGLHYTAGLDLETARKLQAVAWDVASHSHSY